MLQWIQAYNIRPEAFRLARRVAEREPKHATALFVAGIAAGRLRKLERTAVKP